jgi:cell wall-associated NlpC family hydrolase
MTAIDRLQLVIPDARSSLLLQDAITSRPELTLTTDGASTLSFSVDDHDRKLAQSEAFTSRSWARLEDLNVNFELVQANKTGHQVTLTFEDAIAAALRKVKQTHRWAAGSATRREIVIQNCRKADVPHRVDPDRRPPIKSAVVRGGKDKTDAWTLTGSLATDIQARRFSNGRRLIWGGDDWLLERQEKPHEVREHTGPWGSVDFDLDVGKRASTATVVVDAEHGAIYAGDAVRIRDDYPATDGLWVVTEYRQTLGATTGTLTLSRKQHTLKEPKKTGAGERGEDNFIPDREGDPGSSAPGPTSNPGREKMISFAMAQRGDAYSWGGNGPSAWDCSGLVQAATAAAGKPLGKPSASQWATCQAQGRTISVAEGLRTRGALLFRIGAGDYNHVAISLGNGSTIEAMGSAYGVLVAGNAATRGWTGAALWI